MYRSDLDGQTAPAHHPQVPTGVCWPWPCPPRPHLWEGDGLSCTSSLDAQVFHQQTTWVSPIVPNAVCTGVQGVTGDGVWGVPGTPMPGAAAGAHAPSFLVRSRSHGPPEEHLGQNPLPGARQQAEARWLDERARENRACQCPPAAA